VSPSGSIGRNGKDKPHWIKRILPLPPKESWGRLSYLTPDRTKPITARKLGDDFDRAAVLETLTQNAQEAARAAEKPAPKQEYPRSIKERLQRGKAAINAPKKDASQREVVQRMVGREAKRAEGKGAGYDRWAAVHNLKQIERAGRFRAFGAGTPGILHTEPPLCESAGSASSKRNFRYDIKKTLP